MNKVESLKEMANSIRVLSMDAVQKAKSGHPGMPMGMADVATILFSEFLNFSPNHPHWYNRDRFVLSAGHGSMLLYSLLYLTGYEDITIDDIKNFRQLHHKCAGHPEYKTISAIETTTGPLGQGLGNAVGMAVAEKILSQRLESDIFNHKIYTIAGDGCLMEGISQEVITLAGHLKLNNLIVLFDDNGISIDGPVSLSDTTDQKLRFESSNWNYLSCDGHNFEDISTKLKLAQDSTKPTIIACKTIIGYGSPNKAGKSSSHGSPMGDDEINLIRQKLKWDYPAFEIPKNILNKWRELKTLGNERYMKWENAFDNLPSHIKEQYKTLIGTEISTDYIESLTKYKQSVLTEKPNKATRVSSQDALEIITHHIPSLIGGSADLTGSNNTKTSFTSPITAEDFSGRYLYYGIRELGMSAIMNGMALHGGIIPYGGTFLVFSDYARPAMRLSALMKIRVIYVMTHDSIGLGEDGPTHQPVEHLASLRAIPNMTVFRPADAIESAECWELALQNTNGPSVLALTRQNLKHFRKDVDVNLCQLGGYVINEDEKQSKLDINLVATGSEVEIAIEAQNILKSKNINARIISMPSIDLFNQQSSQYHDKILGERPSIVIEAGIKQGWEKIIGNNGAFIGMDSFGESGPYKELYEHFGITTDHIVKRAEQIIK